MLPTVKNIDNHTLNQIQVFRLKDSTRSGIIGNQSKFDPFHTIDNQERHKTLLALRAIFEEACDEYTYIGTFLKLY